MNTTSHRLDTLYTQVMIHAMGLVIMAEEEAGKDRSKIAFKDIKDHGNGIFTGYNPLTGNRERISDPTLKQKAEAQINKAKDAATETAANIISSLEQLEKVAGDPQEAFNKLSSQVMSIADQKAVFGNIEIKPEVAIQAIQKNYNQVTKSIGDVFTKLVPKEQQEAFIKEFEKIKEQGKEALKNGKQGIEQFVADTRLKTERIKKDLEGISPKELAINLGAFTLGSFIGVGIGYMLIPNAAVVLAYPPVGIGIALAQSLIFLDKIKDRAGKIDKEMQVIVEDLKKEAMAEIVKQFESQGLEPPDAKQLNIMVTNLAADKLGKL